MTTQCNFLSFGLENISKIWKSKPVTSNVAGIFTRKFQCGWKGVRKEMQFFAVHGKTGKRQSIFPDNLVSERYQKHLFPFYHYPPNSPLFFPSASWIYSVSVLEIEDIDSTNMDFWVAPTILHCSRLKRVKLKSGF